MVIALQQAHRHKHTCTDVHNIHVHEYINSMHYIAVGLFTSPLLH